MSWYQATLSFTLASLLMATAMPADGPVGVRIEFGVGAKQTAVWAGRVVRPQQAVQRVTPWRFLNGRVQPGQNAWTTRTVLLPAPFERNPIQGANFPQPRRVPWSAGVDVVLKDSADVLRVSWQKPEGIAPLEVPLNRLRYGQVQSVGEHVALHRFVPYVAETAPEDGVHDDLPSMAIAPDGVLWLAWRRYQQAADRIVVATVDPRTGRLSPPEWRSNAGDHGGPAIAVDGSGTVWVAYAAQHNGNWDIYVVSRREGRWSRPQRVSDHPQPDLHPVLVGLTSGAALAWQGFREGQSDIFYTEITVSGELRGVHRLSPSRRNDWFPAIATDGRGTVYVAWDSYDAGNYDVLLRPVVGGKPGKLVAVASTDLFEANASVACDRDGGVWVAYDEGTKAWGKDYGFWWWYLDWPRGTRLYERRVLRIRKIEGDRSLAVQPDLVGSLPRAMREYSEYPQLCIDQRNRLWVVFRHRTARSPRADGWAAAGWWEPYLCFWDGKRWSDPIPLERSLGRQDMRTALVAGGNRLWLAWATDSRTARQPTTGGHLKIQVGQVSLDQIAALPGSGLPPVGRYRRPELADESIRNVHPNEEADLERIRSYRVDYRGKQLAIYRGDLHRHTDISFDGVGDGSLTDFYRYALDAASLDYVLVGDHGMGHDREYPWWRTQKSNDMYFVSGRFVPLYGYERSIPYPWGHRNIIWTKRGFRTFPMTRDPRAKRRRPAPDDTLQLYREIRRTGGIVTLHTSATNQGTNWETGYDPELEPVVELFQGYHTSYEGRRQPLAVDENTPILHGPFKPDGYVWHALEKGYWLGFQASSDHIATHNSYACVLAEEFSREGLVEAMKARHTYAATDNIVLEFRSGDALMGDRVRYRGGPVRLSARIWGTAPIAFVEVVRNASVVYSMKVDGASQVEFAWTDTAVPDRSFNYYYVRVIQVDRNVAWASPIWFVKDDLRR